ncbi:MAG: hypothetical protein A2020_15495 [Lentisphaerae bacterium GWF2_45_14]|nr:MAG: hypothetical protein A2020_15495 [Lentisphaerae bacterium GWF2_45_14]
MIDYYFQKLEKRKNISVDPAPVTYTLTESTVNFPEELGSIDFRVLGTNEAPEERALGLFWKNAEYLHAAAIMEDSDVYNTASGKNMKTWATGDVMELFFQPDGVENYYELHLTPEKATLELNLPGEEKRLQVPFESMFYDSGFSYETGKFLLTSGFKGWWGHMKIPFSGIGLAGKSIKNSRFSVCRYNYSHNWEQPEKTSTSFYPEGGFHQARFWHKMI